MNKSTRRGLIRVLVTAAVPMLGLLYIYLFMDITGGAEEKGPDSLYMEKCGNCHGKEGEGLRGLYPPLAGSDYLKTHQSGLPCIIKHGMEGSIVVNGKEYNQAMPGLHELNSKEVTVLINYINNSWGNQAEKVKHEWVEERLKFCPSDE